MTDLLPLFLNLTGRAVLLVGGGPVAAAKLNQLLAAGARVRVVSPEIRQEIADLAQPPQPRDDGPERTAPQVTIAQRAFEPADLDGVWLVVAAATPEVNRQVAEVAETRRVFVNAVDDPANASAFLSGVVRRDGVTLAISTSGQAPALAALLREGLDLLLPSDLASWIDTARAERVVWRRDGVPMEARKPRLLRALNALYGRREGLHYERGASAVCATSGVQDFSPACEPRRTGAVEGAHVPWLSGPEDSWL
jgi:uroporphyrin-III C-methyltransferase / precorrin-2 dehydrogenase / sirohydrochlorin ferrochelatase